MSSKRRRRRAKARAQAKELVLAGAPQTAVTIESVDDAVAPAPTPDDTTVLIREPQTNNDIVAMHMLRLLQGHEQAPVPVNADKVMARLLYAVEHPDSNTMLMAVKDGHLVGYLLLEKQAYDYADAEYLIDWGFYVLPKYRGGDVGPTLLRAARDIATAADLPLYIAIMNPTRRRGSGTKVADIVGFVPHGAILSYG